MRNESFQKRRALKTAFYGENVIFVYFDPILAWNWSEKGPKKHPFIRGMWKLMVFAHTGMKLSLLLSSKTGRGRSEKVSNPIEQRTMAQTEQLTSSIRVGNQYQDQSARAMKQQVHRPFTSQRKEKTKQLNRVSSTTIVPKLGASTSQAITTGGYSIESLLE